MVELTLEQYQELFKKCHVRTFANDDEWHALRKQVIGGSEASVIAGINQYQSEHELWEIKAGIKERKDIENEAIRRGKELEPLLVSMFEVYYGNRFSVIDTKNISLKNVKNEFLGANLDGALIDEDGRLGILEIKTSTIQNGEMLKEWGTDNEDNELIPNNYYCQLLHYMIVTGAEFCVLYAILDIPWAHKQETRMRYLTREECMDDMKWLYAKEKEFWNKVVNNVEPVLGRKKFIL